MKIALTGASGFLGMHIAKRLSERGDQVVGMLRSTSQRDHVAPWLTETITGDLSDTEACTALLEGADCFVHNAVDWKTLRSGDLQAHHQINLVRPIEMITAAFEQKIPVIFVSSVATHHHMHDHWGGTIDALHPTRPGGFYGASKAAIEAHLWALHAMHGQPFTVLRPAAIYGIDPVLSRSIGYPILRDVMAGKPYTRAGGGKFVHVEDVAETVARAAHSEHGDGRIYHLAECYARWCDWAACCCEITGCQVEIDDSSPTAPKNMFDTSDLARDLDLPWTRGWDGIEAHLRTLHALMQEANQV